MKLESYHYMAIGALAVTLLWIAYAFWPVEKKVKIGDLDKLLTELRETTADFLEKRRMIKVNSPSEIDVAAHAAGLKFDGLVDELKKYAMK